MANSEPVPVTRAKLFGARSMPTSELTFKAKVTRSGAISTRVLPRYANAYSAMKPHPTRRNAGDSGTNEASAAE